MALSNDAPQVGRRPAADLGGHGGKLELPAVPPHHHRDGYLQLQQRRVQAQGYPGRGPPSRSSRLPSPGGMEPTPSGFSGFAVSLVRPGLK